MRVKTFKRVSAALLTLVLLAGLMPAAAFAADPVENTAPAVEDLATVDELRTEFDMDDSTAISGLQQTVLRSKTDAMRNDRTLNLKMYLISRLLLKSA